MTALVSQFFIIGLSALHDELKGDFMQRRRAHLASLLPIIMRKESVNN